MQKNIFVESAVTQTQRVAVLDSNHLKKNRATEIRKHQFTNRAVVQLWTGTTKIEVVRNHFRILFLIWKTYFPKPCRRAEYVQPTSAA